MYADFDTFVEEVRRRLDDPLTPDYPDDQLWADIELLHYIDDAQDQFCLETEIFREFANAPYTNIQLAIGTHTYNLHPRLIRVDSARIPARGWKLKHCLLEEIEVDNPNWEQTTGRPRVFATDSALQKITFYPVPSAADVVNMSVVRLANCSVSEGSDPEIPNRYWEYLIPWVLYKAYSKQDIETRDDVKANKCRKEFYENLDEPKRTILKMRYRPRTVRYAGP